MSMIKILGAAMVVCMLWQPQDTVAANTYDLSTYEPSDTSLNKSIQYPLWVQTRALPSDPLYHTQWYLGASLNTNATNTDAENATLNLLALQEWLTLHPEHVDSAVIVAVLDDGFQLDHEDLLGSMEAGFDLSCASPATTCIPFSCDLCDAGVCDCDPSYEQGDAHGTQISGVIAAQTGNGLGISAVCPQCTLLPVRLLGGGGPPGLYINGTAAALGITLAVDQGAAVINNSWGPPDGNPLDPFHSMRLWPRAVFDPTSADSTVGQRAAGELPKILTDAFGYALKNGRSGLGSLIFWSAGNGNELLTYDRFAADPRVLAIGSIGATGSRAYYSDYGPPLFAVAPSSDHFDSPHITTTAILNQYTDRFGGTSASTAMASAVAALVISYFPSLTAAQVAESMALGAVKISPELAHYERYQNGRSPLYGFGRIDPLGALTQAAQYTDHCTLFFEMCGNEQDDNCNGQIDDSSHCSPCVPDALEELCDDHDNNCDGYNNEGFVCIDTARPDCAPCENSSQCLNDSRCRSSIDYAGQWCFSLCQTETDCGTGFSCDGEVCVRDSEDCSDYLFCTNKEICNGIDDNCDGFIDNVDALEGPEVCAAERPHAPPNTGIQNKSKAYDKQVCGCAEQNEIPWLSAFALTLFLRQRKKKLKMS